MNHVTLRGPAPLDAEALGRAWFEAERRSLDEGYEGYPPEWFWMENVEQVQDEWRRGFLDPHPTVETFVAELGRSAVGFAQAGPAEPNPALGALRSLYVHPDVWGKGAGAALHDAALSWLEGRYDEAELWVIEGNRRAREFYEKRGWRETGELRQTTNGLPLVRYMRPFATEPDADIR